MQIKLRELIIVLYMHEGKLESDEEKLAHSS